MSCSAVIRGTHSYGRWEHMQGTIDKQQTDGETLEHRALDGMVPSGHSFLSSGDPIEDDS